MTSMRLFSRRWRGACAVTIAAISLSAAAHLTAASASGARRAAATRYVTLKTMTGPQIPTAGSWIGDVGWVASDRFYFSDLSNARVDVFSASTLRFVGAVLGFSGPGGIATVGKAIWVGNGDSTVRVIDPRTLKLRGVISTLGHKRADELAWDPRDQVVMIGNPSDTPVFASFIDARTRKVLGHLFLRSATGIEQPIWDGPQRLFFVTVPQKTNGEILGISPASRTVRRTYRLRCAPSGLALGPGQDAAVACDRAVLIIDLSNGHTLRRFPSLGGGDQVGYDVGLERYYVTAHAFTATADVAVIDARARRVIAHLPASTLTHSLGVDSHNHRVFIPTSKGVAVLAPRT